MKKTLTINLAGRVYHIDEDAYVRLKTFLDTLEKKFKSEPGKKEIIADIEARIAELLNEKLNNNRQVVTNSDIDYVIEILGDPEVIFENNEETEPAYSRSYERQYRRMYRDADDRIIGGVCAGLAAYWNLDPVLVRVIFIALTILGGSGVLIYLILLIILPEAQTTAQKLEMRGEAVTIESIKNFFTEEFNNVKNSFSKKK
jgi:phage shock protein PspC (stress-responsive transcriptional regulator)